MSAIRAGVVLDSINKIGWADATSRLTMAEAAVKLIADVSGISMEQIAAERNWDLTRNVFSDTDSRYVNFLAYAGVTSGVGYGKYSPDSSATRAQIVTIIGRMGEAFFGETAQGPHPFTDVPDWAAPYVGYAVNKGITSGTSRTKFSADSTLQNQHTAIFAYKAYLAWR